jgi:hypothetical protein
MRTILSSTAPGGQPRGAWVVAQARMHLPMFAVVAQASSLRSSRRPSGLAYRGGCSGTAGKLEACGTIASQRLAPLLLASSKHHVASDAVRTAATVIRRQRRSNRREEALLLLLPEFSALNKSDRERVETEQLEVGGVRGDEALNAGGPEDGGELGVENALAAQLMELQPVER